MVIVVIGDSSTEIATAIRAFAIEFGTNAAGIRHTKAKYAGALIGLGRNFVQAGKNTVFEKVKRSAQITIAAESRNVLVIVAMWLRFRVIKNAMANVVYPTNRKIKVYWTVR